MFMYHKPDNAKYIAIEKYFSKPIFRSSKRDDKSFNYVAMIFGDKKFETEFNTIEKLIKKMRFFRSLRNEAVHSNYFVKNGLKNFDTKEFLCFCFCMITAFYFSTNIWLENFPSEYLEDEFAFLNDNEK